ncbi:MAG: DUF2145 domain-containing protein [Pseudomonadota bacterium]
MKANIFIAISTLLITLVSDLSLALSQNEAGTEPASFAATESIAFSKEVERLMANSGARLFIVARKGRPNRELPRGIEYTHTGFGVYSSIALDDGSVVPGYAMYNLYQREDSIDRSSLVVDFPADFFAPVYALEAAIIVPNRKLQQRLLEVIHSDVYGQLHNPRYSAIANPFNSRYQNCTEHMLDVINAAIYGTDDRKELKQVARAHFDAQRVNVNPLTLMLGGLFQQDVALSDHKGEIATSTFGAIARYLKKYAMVESAFRVRWKNGEVEVEPI